VCETLWAAFCGYESGSERRFRPLDTKNIAVTGLNFHPSAQSVIERAFGVRARQLIVVTVQEFFDPVLEVCWHLRIVVRARRGDTP
jgi:hypothetical protein